MSGRKAKGRKKCVKQKQKAELKKSIKTVGCDFPFLCESTTVRYISKSKVIFVMRGLPGSGKSEICRLLEKVYKKAVTCSADDYFQKSDAYQFDVSQLAEAHKSCFDEATGAAEKKKSPIIIDNTHVRRWEMKKYFGLAKDYNYVVVIVLPKTPWSFDAGRLAELNKHSVSVEEIQKKIADFEVVLPKYWGWFLNEVDSEKLLEMANNMLELCLKSFPEFSRYLREHVSLKDGQKLTFSDVFLRNPSRRPMLHCTSKFAGKDKKKPPSVVEYAENKIVKESIGRCFSLRIAGVIITPRTIGCRVILNDQQLELWANDDEKLAIMATEHVEEDIAVDTGNPSKGSRATEIGKEIHSEEAKSLQISQELSDISIQDSTNVKTDAPNGDGDSIKESLDKQNNEDNIGETATEKESCSSASNTKMSSNVNCCDDESVDLPPGSKAHITLGFVESSEAVQTGIDQLEVLSCVALKKRIGHPVVVDDLTISYYGKGRCMVDFGKHRPVYSLFSGSF